MVMKKTMLIAAAVLTLSLAASAQGRGQRPQGERPDEATMIKMRTERMTKELGLDEEQSAKLLELNQKYPTAMFRGNGGPGGPGRPGMERPRRGNKKDGGERQELTEEQKKAMEEAKEAREAYETELKEILTEEQFKTWQEKRPGGRAYPSQER